MEITRDIATKVLQVVDAGLVPGLGIAEPGKMCVEAAVCFALGEPHGDEPSCVALALRNLKIWLNDADWSSNQSRARGLRRLALAQLGSKGALDEKEFVRRVVDYALRVSAPSALRAAASVCKKKECADRLIAAARRCGIEGTRKAALEGKNTAAHAAGYAATHAAHAAAAAAHAAAAAAHAAAAHAADAAAATADAAHAAGHAAAAHAAAATSHAVADAAYAHAAADASRDKSLAEYTEAVVQILIEMKAPGCQWLDLAPLEAAS